MVSAAPPVFRLRDLVARFGGELVGDGETVLEQVAPLESAGPRHIAFLARSKFRRLLETTRAGAVIVGARDRDATALPRIVAANPSAYFARVMGLFNPPCAQMPVGIHARATVDASATVAPSARIGANVWVGPGAQIGERVELYPGCFIGAGVKLGDDCVLHANVSVYHDCVIGRRVIVHAGAVIGADGFGLALEDGKWLKVPQIGRVVIGDDVEIGANTTIDRGAMDDTVIEEGVKLDNLIQVAHNVRIGAHTAMAGCVGIAGSARIGRHCTVAGAAMIIGHLEIADHVNISVGTLVTKSITEPGTYTSAIPCQPHETWLRTAVHLRHLDAMAERVKQLETRLAALERKET
jgi:UDP-3-O-[3-hydroxymyristoyl] glucosamine N-acyltransferase